jgi:hypothetical protein
VARSRQYRRDVEHQGDDHLESGPRGGSRPRTPGTRGRTDLGRPRQFWPTKAGWSWRWAGTEEAVTPSARYGGRPSFSPPRPRSFPWLSRSPPAI